MFGDGAGPVMGRVADAGGVLLAGGVTAPTWTVGVAPGPAIKLVPVQDKVTPPT